MAYRIRPARTDRAWANDLNPVIYTLTGLKGGGVKLWGHDGTEVDAQGNTTGTSKHALQVRSGIGKHVLVRNAGDTADLLRIEDGGTLHDAGTYSRWYGPSGVAYGQIAAADTGKLTVTGSGTSAGVLGATAFEAVSYVSVGASPATSGAIRLLNAGNITWRNFANTADVADITHFTDNNLYLGSGTANTPQVILRGATDVYPARIAGVDYLHVGTAGALEHRQITAPTSTTASNVALYPKSDTIFYKRTPAGVESRLLDAAIVTAAGQLVVGQTSNAFTVLALGATGTVLKAGATAPTWGAISVTDITTGAINNDPPVVTAGGNETTSSLSIVAMAAPTFSISTIGGVCELQTRMTVNASTASIINLYSRVDSGGWSFLGHVSPPSSAGRFELSGFEVYSGLADTGHLFELGWSTSAGTATVFGGDRRLSIMNRKR